jgi:hypothetical protein
VTVDDLVAVLISRDVTALSRALHPEVVLVSDGGGQVVTPLRPVQGADAVAALLASLVASRSQVTVEPVNGRPGLVVRADGLARAVIAVTIASSVVTRVWLVLNPDKLGGWHRRTPGG